MKFGNLEICGILSHFCFVFLFQQRKALNLPVQNPSHLVQARLACLTRALDWKEMTMTRCPHVGSLRCGAVCSTGEQSTSAVYE